MVSAWLLGNYVGSRRAYTAELEYKNRQLEQARLELADRAVAEERLRIARELHDVVAHSLSVVALHAGTARMVADDNPVAARVALGHDRDGEPLGAGRDAPTARGAARLG